MIYVYYLEKHAVYNILYLSSIIIINYNILDLNHIFFSIKIIIEQKNILYWRSLVNYFFAYSTKMVGNVVGN